MRKIGPTLVLVALLLAGCQGTISMPAVGDADIDVDTDTDTDTDPAPRITILGLGLAGTTEHESQVEVAGAPDQDGAADKVWHAEFVLDGGSGATSLPEDRSGAARTYRLDVTATRSSDGDVVHKRAGVTLYE